MTRPTGGAATVTWDAVVDDIDAGRALEVAEDVGRRLRDPEAVADAIEVARARSDPRLEHWRAEGLWQGHAGLVLLFAALDAARPGDGWDHAGHHHLQLAAGGAERRATADVGLSRGLSGLGTAAWALSRGGTRYQGLLTTIDRALAHAVTERSDALRASRPHGLGVSTFDVINGLSGAGRHLLTRHDASGVRPALEAVLAALVHLAEEDADGVPRCHTGPTELAGSFSAEAHPLGHVNLGLAHGIPGPLALLARALIEGVEVDGQRAAIDRLVRWVQRAQLEDAWGVNFPTVVAITPPGRSVVPVAAPRPSRSAWCYGAPGIAQALWLAGVATDDGGCRDLAVSAVEAVHRRPIVARQIDSPTVCHGVAGLLLVMLRFRHQTGLPVFTEAARGLVAQLLAQHEPASRFGYRTIEPGGGRYDHPGLLDGAAGVALALVAAATPLEPTWDRSLLLS